jgi:hypothetical protein
MLKGFSSTTTPCLLSSTITNVIGSITMDVKQLQNIEVGLCEQVEATQATNELIAKLFSMINTLQAKDVTIPPPALMSPPPPATTTPKVMHTSQIKPSTPNNFDGNSMQGRTFLTLCKLYMLLTGSDFPDDQVHIHWALSFFKSGCAATFPEHIVRQEMKSGQMMFIDWNTFTSEFASAFCPKNEVTMALM